MTTKAETVFSGKNQTFTYGFKNAITSKNSGFSQNILSTKVLLTLSKMFSIKICM